MSELRLNAEYGSRYEVIAKVGEGGMQHVYKAVDKTLARQVALKVPKNAAAERRFQRSAALSAKVSHPNVAKTLDYFEESGVFFLAEEFISGMDLSDFRQRIPRLDPYSVATVLHNLARAIRASHRVGVIHRDLKPSNIMVDGTYQLSTVKVTDFGIAKMAEHEMAEAAESEATITSSHTMMGALPYLAPEMIRGPKNASFGADIWAIGAIAFELLCGSKPFGGGLAAVPAILEHPCAPLPNDINIQFRPLVSDLHSLIIRCLEKAEADRPDSDQLVNECEKLCYQTPTRSFGRVANYHRTYGFISESGSGQKIFFHPDSVYGPRPNVGDPVWFAKHAGDPRSRAHPVVKCVS
jgi:serine/threonine protein kinase